MANAILDKDDPLVESIPSVPPPTDAPQSPKRDKEFITAAEARRLELIAKARLKQIEVDEREGSIIAVDELKKEQYSIARTIRDALLNIPDRVYTIVAAETSANEVHKILTREVNQVLEELSRAVAECQADIS